MTQRHAAQAVAVVLAACLLCVVLPGALPPARAQSDAVAADAQPAAPVAYPPHEVRKRIGAILDDPVFGRTETGWRYEYRRGDEEEAKDPAWLARFFKWLRRTVGLFAEGARAIVWVAVASALALAIYLVLRYRERLGFGPTTRHAPQTLFGLDVRPQSLPADIGAAAKELLAAGDVAAALSLLYRGALSALIHFAGVEFRAGDTEGDCWRRVQPVLRGDGLGYFRMLLDAWLWTAYGRRPPRSDELAALCREWPRHFAREALVPPEREAT
jgi:hypothetical protein